ncbi:MAG: hypothetical protein WEC39_02350 [Patescibacteria group bacterium]
MENKVTLENGIITQLCAEEQTYQSMHGMLKETNQFADQLHKEKKEVLILTDFSLVKRAGYGAKKASMEGLADPKHDKVAIFGATPFFRLMGEAIIKSSQAGEKIKHFATKAEAVNWLREEDKVKEPRSG